MFDKQHYIVIDIPVQEDIYSDEYELTTIRVDHYCNEIRITIEVEILTE